jgi:hypothetical protein
MPMHLAPAGPNGDDLRGVAVGLRRSRWRQPGRSRWGGRRCGGRRNSGILDQNPTIKPVSALGLCNVGQRKKRADTKSETQKAHSSEIPASRAICEYKGIARKALGRHYSFQFNRQLAFNGDCPLLCLPINVLEAPRRFQRVKQVTKCK